MHLALTQRRKGVDAVATHERWQQFVVATASNGTERRRLIHGARGRAWGWVSRDRPGPGPRTAGRPAASPAPSRPAGAMTLRSNGETDLTCCKGVLRSARRHPAHRDIGPPVFSRAPCAGLRASSAGGQKKPTPRTKSVEEGTLSAMFALRSLALPPNTASDAVRFPRGALSSF